MPYTRVDQDVTRALDATGCAWEPHDVSGDEEAYWRLLSTLWAAGKTFAIVEHDVVVRATTLEELRNCPSPWCSFQVPYVGGCAYAGLGCAKFDAELIRRHPDALNEVATFSDEQHSPRHWCRLDHWLQDCVLKRRGEAMCVHGPPLKHLRANGDPMLPSHGCS